MSAVKFTQETPIQQGFYLMHNKLDPKCANTFASIMFGKLSGNVWVTIIGDVTQNWDKAAGDGWERSVLPLDMNKVRELLATGGAE